MTISLLFAIFCYVLAIIPFTVLFEMINDYESLLWLSLIIGTIGCIIFLPMTIATLLCGNTSLEGLAAFITRVHRGTHNND